MKKAWIICREGEMLLALQNCITKLGCQQAHICHTAAKARVQLNTAAEINYDLAVINAPLPDEFGTFLLRDLYETLDLPCVILVPNAHAKETSDFIQDIPSFVIPKPVNINTLEQSFQLSFDAFQKMAILNEKNHQLEQKLEDTKVINRAKWTLISVLGMSEHQAHRHIQKRAMDERVTPRRIADDILKTYEY